MTLEEVREAIKKEASLLGIGSKYCEHVSLSILIDRIVSEAFMAGLNRNDPNLKETVLQKDHLNKHGFILHEK